MSCDEILDVVSKEDKVIKKEKRSVIYQQKLHFRVINAFICNSEKKLWIPRRHPDKKLFPLYLDCSVGGHVMSGEDYETAFIRETQEELNIDITKINFKKVARLTPFTHGTSAFMWVYIIYSNDVPAFNKNDFVEYYWLKPNEVSIRLMNGDKAKSDLLPILKEIEGKL
ncbi:MAG: NUDIX hydrolase [Candidatus Dependentiae bacterium]